MESTNHINFDKPGTKVLSPSTLAHVVLRTGQFKRMIDFYVTFLGGHVTVGNEFISFITYDDEHHRIALLGDPNTVGRGKNTSGLEHIAFTFPTLSALLLAYRQRKSRGILPAWCVNHGPTTSIYYKDPDGNMLETQVDNFDSVEAASEFMNSKEFMANPIGTDFDPEVIIQKIKDGQSEPDLKKRVEIGSRPLPDFDAM